tara:strand:- start:615 stop:1142 length:528 start_codon:yes stop_codon:yes gene_type:complete
MLKYKFTNLLTTTLLTETLFLTAFRFREGKLKWKSINNWYTNLKWSAVLLDILSILIGFYISIYIYNLLFKYNYIGDHQNEKLNFLLILLVVQISHDLLFYYLIIKNSKLGESDVMDEFIDYSKKVGINAIIGDSFMYIVSIPILYYFVKKNEKSFNTFLCILSFYFIGYLLYKK